MKMSKTLDELLNNSLWSAHHFLPHAQYIFPKLLDLGCHIKYGRTTVHISFMQRNIKLYPHYHGKSNEWVTAVNTSGTEKSFHYNEDSESIYLALLQFINEA